MNSQKDFDVKYKVLLIGESKVGKTSLIRCLMGDNFNSSLMSTYGIDFVKKIFEIDGARVMLEIWDTAGQERFRTITKFHFRGTRGLLIVYDITQKSSFDKLTYWMQSIDKEIDADEPPPKLIIGNKSDLEEMRQVPYVSGEQIARENFERGFEETSAKENKNVHQVFERLAEILVDTYNPSLMNMYKKNPDGPQRQDKAFERKQSIKLDPNSIKQVKQKEKSCCS
ncbi:ras-related protein Rab-13-like [Lineus longissimus]|uniref:ras-related protein Rab-13-like n=1 Tax=Lineus longissimus TaxID=88925 RepID=UPI002B4E14E4